MDLGDPCIVCTAENTNTVFTTDQFIHQNCPNCGEFKVTSDGLDRIGEYTNPSGLGLGHKKRAILSSWIVSQSQSGAVPTLTANIIDELLCATPQ